ncbi:hypothetical protein ES703_102343 [subsurface metagenome]
MNDLDNLIRYWKDHLAKRRLQMHPSTIYQIEQTIKCLEELRKLAGVEL